MKNKKAFPGIKINGLTREYFVGMDLVDYFATKAMQGYISDSDSLLALKKVAIECGVKETRIISKAAYELADAMIKERNIREKDNG